MFHEPSLSGARSSGSRACVGDGGRVDERLVRGRGGVPGDAVPGGRERCAAVEVVLADRTRTGFARWPGR